MTRIEAEKRLKTIFGIERFYDEQREAIDRILRGERILMIERTGFSLPLRRNQRKRHEQSIFSFALTDFLYDTRTGGNHHGKILDYS